MKVLVIGSGGREHALALKLKQSAKTEKIYAIPGNAGMAQIAQCVPGDILDFDFLTDFVEKQGIDFTVVGPELPLVKGIVDVFEAKGLRIFGPTKAAAQLEGSKIFTKDIMKKYQVPTAQYEVFTDGEKAKAYAIDQEYPLVIKADGLCAGKRYI